MRFDQAIPLSEIVKLIDGSCAPEHLSFGLKGINEIHKVEKGETLFMISQKYKVSVKKLLKMNNLGGNTIFIGQLLRVS